MASVDVVAYAYTQLKKAVKKTLTIEA